MERMWVFAGGDDTTDVREWALRSGNSRCTELLECAWGGLRFQSMKCGLYLSHSPGPDWQRESWKAHVQNLVISSRHNGKRVSVGGHCFAEPLNAFGNS